MHRSDDSLYPVTGTEFMRCCIQVQADGGFFNWVAGMGGNVIITGPECVREEYKKYLESQLALYK